MIWIIDSTMVTAGKTMRSFHWIDYYGELEEIVCLVATRQGSDEHAPNKWLTVISRFQSTPYTLQEVAQQMANELIQTKVDPTPVIRFPSGRPILS
jgi:hypothetical protein